MSHLEIERAKRLREELISHGSKFAWAPALANGAGILSLANIVANSQHQDTAMSAVSGSLSLFGLGLVLGLIRIHFFVSWLTARSRQSDVWLEQQRIESEIPEAHLMRRVPAPVKDDLATWVAQENDRQRSLDKLNGWEYYDDEAAKAGRFEKFFGIGGTLSGWIAVLCCALAFLFLLGGHASGYLRLEPHASNLGVSRQSSIPLTAAVAMQKTNKSKPPAPSGAR